MTAKIEESDILGNGFLKLDLPLADDNDGTQHATLVYRKLEKSQSKAILYVHGFIDYFFQTEMADIFNQWGYDFYALDLRKYGRSLIDHQHPNFVSNIHDYFDEINQSIDIIKSNGNSSVLLMGHSTGGLITSIYTHHHNNIDGLILNSPFFDLNIPPALKIITPLVTGIGKYFPYLSSDNLTQHYPKSLHKDYKGEWDFNEKWKPITNFPTYFGWLRAITKAQKELQSGLNIKCPILVMYSDKSYKGKTWDEIIRVSDAVLDVEHIQKYADGIGKNISKIEIKDGIHDLVLSKKEVRESVYNKLKEWLREQKL